MANQPHQFKHRDVVRAFKAAAAAGVSNPTVEVRCPNGTTISIGGGGKVDEGAIPRSATPRPGKSPASSRRVGR